MTKEKPLAKKQFDIDDGYHLTEKGCYSIDVKEAVERLKDGRMDNLCQESQNEIIDKIFGDFGNKQENGEC